MNSITTYLHCFKGAAHCNHGGIYYNTKSYIYILLMYPGIVQAGCFSSHHPEHWSLRPLHMLVLGSTSPSSHPYRRFFSSFSPSLSLPRLRTRHTLPHPQSQGTAPLHNASAWATSHDWFLRKFKTIIWWNVIKDIITTKIAITV